MVHHGFRSKEARRARKQKYRLHQATSHSSLLVARQDDVSRKLNQAFLVVDSFNFNFVDEERSDIFAKIDRLEAEISHKQAVRKFIYTCGSLQPDGCKLSVLLTFFKVNET